jgi:hypothetical protein
MRLPARLSATALLTMALVVAACGGSGAAPSASPAAPSAPASEAPGGATPTPAPTDDGADPTAGTALDACEIVTPGDIEAAVPDAEVEDGELKERPTSLSPGRTECTYQGDWGRLIVELTPEDGANLYDAARGSYADAVDITGVGDGAFNSDGQKRAFVWQGSVAVMFTMFVNGVERYDLAEDLAKAVVDKL